MVGKGCYIHLRVEQQQGEYAAKLSHKRCSKHGDSCLACAGIGFQNPKIPKTLKPLHFGAGARVLCARAARAAGAGLV